MTRTRPPTSARDSDVADRHERVARSLVDAFNSREPEAWMAVFHPDVEFRPSLLVGGRSVYRGHEGVLRYLEQVRADGSEHRSRVRLVRAFSPAHFIVFTEVMLGDKVISPAAVIVRLAEGRIIEATAYLSDERTLDALGLTPGKRDDPQR